MSTDPRHIELTPEQQAELAALAEASGKPWNIVLKEALAAYRAKQLPQRKYQGESVFDLASRLGLIGCLSDGPPDLSTNPNYMQGFGK